MKIDWQRKADPKGVAGAKSLLERSSGLEDRGGLESWVEQPGAASRASELEQLERLCDALAAAEPTAPDDERSGMKENVLAGARTGLAKVNQGEPLENFTLGEHIGLESVILTDGTRPSSSGMVSSISRAELSSSVIKDDDCARHLYTSVPLRFLAPRITKSL